MLCNNDNKEVGVNKTNKLGTGYVLQIRTYIHAQEPFIVLYDTYSVWILRDNWWENWGSENQSDSLWVTQLVGGRTFTRIWDIYDLSNGETWDKTPPQEAVDFKNEQRWSLHLWKSSDLICSLKWPQKRLGNHSFIHSFIHSYIHSVTHLLNKWLRAHYAPGTTIGILFLSAFFLLLFYSFSHQYLLFHFAL